MASSPKERLEADERAREPEAAVLGSLSDAGALRFWIAVILTGLAAGVGAALLTQLLKEVQGLAWGATEPSALIEAVQRASPLRHVMTLLAAGLLTGVGQWLLTRLSSGGDLVSGRAHAGLAHGQAVAQALITDELAPLALLVLLPIRRLAMVAAAASGAPGGLFTPSLAAGALMGSALGQVWLALFGGGAIGLFALLGAGAMLAATTQGPHQMK